MSNIFVIIFLSISGDPEREIFSRLFWQNATHNALMKLNVANSKKGGGIVDSFQYICLADLLRGIRSTHAQSVFNCVCPECQYIPEK